MSDPLVFMSTESTSKPPLVGAAEYAADHRDEQVSIRPNVIGENNPADENAGSFDHASRISYPHGENANRVANFYDDARTQFIPRDALEKLHLKSLLRSRMWEDFYISIEVGVLQRCPISQTLEKEKFLIFNESKDVAILGSLGRYYTHNSRLFEKSVTALMPAVQAQCKPYDADHTPPLVANESKPGGAGISVPPINRGTLADLLADHRLVFPGEDAAGFAAMAKDLFSTLQPANIIEGFVAVDIVVAEWRLERLERMKGILFGRLSISATGAERDASFAFVNDYQSNRALEPLLQYESALRRHHDKRLKLHWQLKMNGGQNGADTAKASAGGISL